MRYLILLLPLFSCTGVSFPLYLEPLPADNLEFHALVTVAATAWNESLPDCQPFLLGQGTTVTLVPAGEWKYGDGALGITFQKSRTVEIRDARPELRHQILLHELGHSIGLNHSTEPADVMFPTLGGENPVLTVRDIAGASEALGCD
jgi:hypothetical protein